MDTLELHRSIIANAHYEFSKAGGPGGQNVNKTNTKVTLRVPVAGLAGLSDEELSLVRERLAARLDAEGNLYLSSREERSQAINREKAIARLFGLIRAAAKRKLPRIPTRATRTAKEKRLRLKKARSGIKDRRKSPDPLE